MVRHLLMAAALLACLPVLAVARINSPMRIVEVGGGYGIELPSGMSEQLDASGGYWALVGTAVNPVTGGALTGSAPDLSDVFGDAGVSGLFASGIGVWGAFSSSEFDWSSLSGVYANGFACAGGIISLYLLDDNVTAATLVDTLEISAPTYLLTVTVSGGQGQVAPATDSYEADAVVTVTATPAAGYRVKAWSNADTVPAAGATTNTVTMTEDKIVSVEFELIPVVTYTLTTAVSSGLGTISTGGTYDEDTVVTLTATPADGYRVKSWSNADSVPAAGATTNTVTMTADKTVTVAFEEIPTTNYTLGTSVAGEGGAVSAGGVYPAGTVVTLTATPAAGYQVKAWSGADSAPAVGATTNTVTMTADKTVTVEFEEIPPAVYTLTTGVVGAGGAISAGGDYEEGTVVTLTATPAVGYQVADWAGADNTPATGQTTNTVTMTADKTVTVSFEETPLAEYLLTVTVAAGQGQVARSPEGTATDGGWLYTEGTTVTLTASAVAGYTFYGWQGTDSDATSAATNQVTLTADTDVAALFSTAATASRVVVKAGPRANTDMLQYQGAFPLTAAELAGTDGLTLTITAPGGFRYRRQIDFVAERDLIRDRTFKYTWSTAQEYLLVQFDLLRQDLRVILKNADLTGLASPITVSLAAHAAVVTATADEDTINGNALVPLQLQQGWADALRVTRATFRAGVHGRPDTLVIQGEIAVADETLDLEDVAVALSWGDYSTTLPVGTLTDPRGRGVYQARNSGGVKLALFDLGRGTFRLILADSIGEQDNPALFAVDMAGFDADAVAVDY